ncbi:transcription termination factor MTERF15, mitochondrial [Malania oleifera]|uniref:transcription termination factor MTERF15, mitochondrial n=1 Tax=Malania oleifera TaxID=397392 RepID=UPI0025ADB777|nr:transcription termination factor MTERF15, mitochondrial [Malania oleifera]
MAVRFLTKHVFHHLTSVPKPIPTLSIHKFQSFSTEPKPRISICPDYSEHSQYRKQIFLASLLRRYGFPASQLPNFLNKNRFLLDWDVVEIEKSLGILFSFKFSQKDLVSMVCNCPGVLEFDFLKKWKMGISEIGFLWASPSMIQSVLEFSRRFHLDPDYLKKNARILQGFGLSDGTVARILEEFPRVMMMKEAELLHRIEFLMEIGFPRNVIDRLYFMFPEMLRYSVEDRLKPLFDEFRDLGFVEDLVRKEIGKHPRILGMELGELSRCLELLKTLKCRVPIKDRILRGGAFRAGFEVKLRVDCLCRHGLIRREAFKVLWKEPRVIVYEIKDIEKKIEFLIQTLKFDISWLVEVPEYLGVNFEKQIIPRYNVIEYLRSKGGLGCEVGLTDLIKLSRLRFYNLYVKPYPECEKIFGKLSKDVEVKNRHPVGLWKLLKPQKYTETKEDLRNMKSFVELLF